MKTMIMYILLILGYQTALVGGGFLNEPFQAEPPRYVLTVAVDQFKESGGVLIVDLFDSDEKFLKEPLQTQQLKVGTGENLNVHFEGIPQGNYALSVRHDVNENGALDTNTIGIPAEGYGFSKNVMGMFGPPSFKDAQLKIDRSHTIQIHLR